MSASPFDDPAPDPIWLRAEPGTRRPSHSRQQIAEAAVRIADDEGFDAVSMRRVAQELDAGTMTLYHYVLNKEELVMLMNDRVMGEILVPDDELPGDWRGALTAIARRSRQAFERHRWLLDSVGDLHIGPSGMRHFEQSLQAVEDTGLPAQTRLDLISLVDEFVFGYSMRETMIPGGLEGGEPWPPGTLELFEREMRTGEYPRTSSLMRDDLHVENIGDGTRRVMEILSRPDRFEQGLERLLDGIEVGIAKRG